MPRPSAELESRVSRRLRAVEKPGIVTQAATDAELRSVIATVEGTIREPLGRSYHLHQLDGARLEAVVYLDPAGVRIEWAHGKGDCAITGSGAAILSVLRGNDSADQSVAEGHLVLYGDRDLIHAASTVFSRPAS